MYPVPQLQGAGALVIHAEGRPPVQPVRFTAAACRKLLERCAVKNEGRVAGDTWCSRDWRLRLVKRTPVNPARASCHRGHACLWPSITLST